MYFDTVHNRIVYHGKTIGSFDNGDIVSLIEGKMRALHQVPLDTIRC